MVLYFYASVVASEPEVGEAGVAGGEVVHVEVDLEGLHRWMFIIGKGMGMMGWDGMG